MTPESATPRPGRRRPQHPFRRAVVRGLGVVLPPLLTVVIFLWVGSSIQQNVLQPVTGLVRDVLVWSMSEDIRQLEEIPGARYASPTDTTTVVDDEGRQYKRTANGEYVPLPVWNRVARTLGSEPMPDTGTKVYRRFVTVQYLQPYVVVPVFFSLFILVMYLVGSFLAAGIGRVFWNLFERAIGRLPLVRNVYSSVKQVTDFMFNESDLEYTRIVALEYPRRGIWSLGIVTSESMRQIRESSGEPMLSVLIPSSPMPMTGYTINVPRRDVIDLDISIDEAFQFCISCGVVIPPKQSTSRFEIERVVSREIAHESADERSPGEVATSGPSKS